MAKKELTKEQEQIARIAKALGHPIRVAILQMLARRAVITAICQRYYLLLKALFRNI